MRLLDLLGLISYNLSRRKGRVALTAIGVVIGTAAVVILVSLGNGLQRSATNQLGSIADLTSIYVMPQYDQGNAVPMGGGGGGGGVSQVKLLTESALAEIAAVPGVSQIITRDYLKTQSVIDYARLEAWANVMGVGASDVADLGYTVKEGVGRLERGTAVIGEPMLRNFMDPKQRPGQDAPEPPDLLDQQVKLVMTKYTSDGQEVKKTIQLRIVGILKESRNEGDYSLIVSMADLTGWNEWAMGQRINRNREGYDQVTVKVDNVDDVLAVADSITALGFMAYTAQSAVQGVSNFYIIVQVIFGGVGAVALLVAAIGIANTMAMAILERTREIGLMKAIGATNRDVLSIFLGEAAGIGFLGGVGGVALGWLVGQAINAAALPYLASQAAQMGTPPPDAAVYTPAWLPVFAIVFATIIGLISGLYPALRAATMVPVVALKYE
ncbi:MAG TPA: ABC transporter permease [Anaerolineaceae bacterium]